MLKIILGEQKVQMKQKIDGSVAKLNL
ncbi:hypothetical protein ACUW98_002138 [Staphylococcus capitis]